jgi:NTP pyrophosphatase (non-canonical NTP hydrolase)
MSEYTYDYTDRATLLHLEPTLNNYQNLAVETALYKGQGEFQGFCYVLFKLAGEAGEICEKMGKLLRDNGVEWGSNPKEWPEEIRLNFKKEFGDVFWYIAAGMKELGYTLQDCGETNVAKLQSRQERGVVHGSGDDR